MQSDLQGPAIAVLACGTRGDVQPLLALSSALNEGFNGGCDVTLVTHAAHQVSGAALGEHQTLPPLGGATSGGTVHLLVHLMTAISLAHAMQAWLERPAGDAGLQLHFLSSLPARQWDGAEAAGGAAQVTVASTLLMLRSDCKFAAGVLQSERLD